MSLFSVLNLVAEADMVAGDTKRVIVIKNISSNLIEEAILILKNDPGPKSSGDDEKRINKRQSIRNDFILREAENNINQYIREHGLTVPKNYQKKIKKERFFKISLNMLINGLLFIAAAFLVFVLSRLF